MDDFELELKLDFLNESVDLLESAESAFLRLETDRDDPDLLNEIFRLAHNLKGTSKAVGFDQLSELTHVAENLILKLKDGSLAVSDSIVSTLLDFNDKVQEMIEGLKIDINALFEIDKLKNQIEQAVNGKIDGQDLDSHINEKVENQDSIEAKEENEFSAFEKLLKSSDISRAAIESLRESGLDDETIIQMLSEEVSSSEETETNDNTIKSAENNQLSSVQDNFSTEETIQPTKNIQKAGKTEIEESIRVKLSRIDKISNVVGELVILQTVMSQRRYEYCSDELMNKTIGTMGKLFKEVQDLTISLRMLPLKPTFQKMTRIVRDTSKLLGKEVHLNLIGENTEVDKTVLEKISDPLVHIVRNAVDHGLEMSDDRVNQGKDKIGTVELFTYHEGSNLVIQVTDDGKGINPDIIRQKAVEKGVLTSETKLTDQELIQLIFHPGLSTKEEVSEVSGRGVGMDVVKSNIESIGGKVYLSSKLGEGSSVKIVLPLTLAITEGIVIKSDKDRYVIPQAQVYEILQVKSREVESFSGVSSLFKLRGEILPLFHLNSKIGKNPCCQKESYTVIVTRGLDYSFGVVVEDIMNQQQIVIKKLGADLKNKKGFIGSTIMADGMPALILDLLELYRHDLRANQAHKKLKQRNLNIA